MPTRSRPATGASEPERADGPLRSYLSARREWLESPTRPAPPADVGLHLSAALDRDLGALAQGFPDFALLATGGYGRRELCLFSDVDLLLLHEGDVPEPAVKAVLYPLWDAGLKVGHATRTVASTIAFAREDFPSLCSLLTARLIAGNQVLGEELTAGLGRLLASPRIAFAERLAAEERRVWSLNPFPVQELDLKTGRGGLRSLHRLRWDRIRSALLGEEVTPPDLAEERSGKILLAVRTALHAVEARSSDRYALDLRGRVGEWLRRDPLELATEVYQAALAIDARAGVRWNSVPLLVDDPVARAGRAVLRFVRARWSRPTALGGGAATPFVFARSTLDTGGRLSQWQHDFAARASPPEWTPGDRGALLSLLAAGSQGWEALGSLWEAGWLTRALPEIGHVRGLAQAAPFHRYPVDAHLGATVAQVVELSDHGWTGEVADEIGGLDEVLLSAFLHDAGKGLAGSSPQDDHSNLGARLATDLLLRTGFGAAQADLVARAVRHHLILPDVALRRDIDDAKVIDEVALTIGDPGLLRILALLSIADLRATGPEMWSDWKDALIRSLYLKLAGRLAAQVSPLNAGLEQEVELLTADLPPGTVTNHLALMPAPYLTQFDPVVIASHVRLAVGLPEGGIRSFGISATPASTFIVAARDRPGLLATIAGVLALHNLNVLEARITTRSDGVAIDTFRVDDALGSGMVGQGRWPGVRNDLAAAASGEIDLTARLVAKRRDYRISGPQVESQVQVWDHEGARFIEVRATDRVGLLHDVASAVTALGLDVTFAKIDTRGSLAIDVFEARSRRDHSPERTRTELLRVLRSE